MIRHLVKKKNLNKCWGRPWICGFLKIWSYYIKRPHVSVPCVTLVKIKPFVFTALITRSLSLSQCVHKVTFAFRKGEPLVWVLRECCNWIIEGLEALFIASLWYFRVKWSLGLTAGLQGWLDYCEKPWPIRTRAGIMLVLFPKKTT